MDCTGWWSLAKLPSWGPCQVCGLRTCDGDPPPGTWSPGGEAAEPGLGSDRQERLGRLDGLHGDPPYSDQLLLDQIEAY